MQNLYRHILKFSGYFYQYGFVHTDTPLEIEMGRHGTYIAKPRYTSSYFNKKQLMILTYKILIGLLIGWTVPYGLYRSIDLKTSAIFGRTIFQIMIVIQYIIGIAYFKKDHFYTHILGNADLLKIVQYMIPFTTLISLSLSITYPILLQQSYQFNLHSEIYNSANSMGQICICVILFMESLYTYQTFLISCVLFSINMLYHKWTISEYSCNLLEYVRRSTSTIEKINIVAIEYSQMKGQYNTTVDHLNPFFSSLNFIGFPSIYFYIIAITKNDVSPTEITNIALFLLIEMIYIVSIQSVGWEISNIAVTLRGNNFITTFFGSKKIDLFDHNEYQLLCTSAHNTESMPSNNSYGSNNLHHDKKSSDTHQSILKNILIISLATDQMLNWVALQNIVAEKLNSFTLFGIEISNQTILSKVFGLIISILIFSEVSGLFNWWV